jgi:cobalamin biosynthesis Co2+ chelatase CbiK
VDLDNVIAHSSGYPDFKLTKPLVWAKEGLIKLEQNGWKVIIYTARHWGEYEDIEKWLNKNKLPFRRLVCGKPLFKYMIDDRNIEFDPNKPKESWLNVVVKVGKYSSNTHKTKSSH